MDYDGATHNLVLFGGAGAGSDLNDTWTWDGAGWTEQKVPGPRPRFGPGLAPRGDAVVLFGGEANMGVEFLRDTWIWNGSIWTEQHGGSPGTSILGAQLAPLEGSVVLLGVEAYGDESAATWLWNGSAWTQQAAAGPPDRIDGAMATLGGTIVLFGGVSDAGDDGEFGDMWVWDGATWTQQNVEGPGPRSGAAMATLNGKVVLFGGFDADGADARDAAGTFFGDTWTWDGVGWAQENVPGPSARSGAAMAAMGATLVLFGGLTADGEDLGDTWIWDGASWSERRVTGPSPRAAAGMSGR